MSPRPEDARLDQSGQSGRSARPPVRVADPGAVDLLHAPALTEAVLRTLASGHHLLGPEVAAFERELAHYVGVGHAVGLGNGTDALTLGLRALGVGAGDAVITVSHTAVATVAAVHATGATPVLVDVGPDDALIDPDAVADTLRRIHDGEGPVAAGSVKAVVAVHLYGACADLERLGQLAREWDVALVEDCAQAHGARYRGHPVGGVGVFGAFSFYPTKNLGAVGDAGALTTSDPDLAERVRRLAQYGWSPSRHSEYPGTNSRLDELQAAVLRVKLPRLDELNERRRVVACRYLAEFAALAEPAGLRLPAAPTNSHVFHQFSVRTPARDHLAAVLGAHGVHSAVHYAVPAHRQPGYAAVSRVAGPGGGRELPHTDAWARTQLSLPVHPALSDDDVARVVRAVHAWAEGAR